MDTHQHNILATIAWRGASSAFTSGTCPGATSFHRFEQIPHLFHLGVCRRSVLLQLFDLSLRSCSIILQLFDLGFGFCQVAFQLFELGVRSLFQTFGCRLQLPVGLKTTRTVVRKHVSGAAPPIRMHGWIESSGRVRGVCPLRLLYSAYVTHHSNQSVGLLLRVSRGKSRGNGGVEVLFGGRGGCGNEVEVLPVLDEWQEERSQGSLVKARAA